MKRVFSSEVSQYIGSEVTVAGWVATVRSHGKLLFIDLRDMMGQVQIVFGPKHSKDIFDLANTMRPEWVIQVVGHVQKRPEGMENPGIPTGMLEIAAGELQVLSKANTLPFAVDTSGYEVSEEKRLKYRYLDLRRDRLHRNLRVRQQVISHMREFLQNENFIEVETPILTKSTPEGARDFLVPSRLQAGKFYALPQSPQQYKQLLQVAGVERYFQIARCFRDEDPRADRQAEFTQLDIEMSFVGQDDILGLIERLYRGIVQKLFPEKRFTQLPFPRLRYQEAMEKYNSDKPDLRKDKNDPNELGFAFVVDFPMFEWKESENRWDAMHHPFTRPQTEEINELKKDPGKALAFQYDFVLNGYEIGGGSLRSFRPEVLEAVFEIMGHEKPEIRDRFGHLLEAFSYGVPPHGGIAPGIDRFLAIVLNEPNIREVMAFPKTGDSRDLMMRAPSGVSDEQLKEVHLHPEKKAQKK
ncbi:MAG: hypothetical protein A2667_03420 [Candidatus Wildermuthbacteria bacterium RIFCSPHIGHO2_01_FULL_47_27]|uniref:Aspartate--tRNA(Asp/Asn) ligase n=2 Tax=Candidatus Wildermuthiibacteriota TaxID=1817923 RepID=A0A1G2RU56_9BACT|nr:MAG: Aspartyl-tRNA synthetase [Parcubacteria group bacterium GW2011_GWA2_47_9]OHA64511.1 MAG: hypothetical protein A2667_03420 [Candidatus Wildermuthbacteria bacterium RIFCSPHIGHO2_01_FULL_47_27]OHA67619.1 MAG: hypothetical protein A3D59_03565 [Candidatus Wildermuthbacteria bacterium RIFCSPHIGHO2_02_FULL_47_17]OHA75919.1 MAG: hypothetical protein A3A32_02390 [Candidatus Wildermuthbacteria bacterium RIFCSPLOWO2_01_FULL_48_35]